MRDFRDALVSIVLAETPITVRGVYYRALSQQLIAAGIKNKYDAVEAALGWLRDRRIVAEDAIVDSTRIRFDSVGYASVEDYLSEVGLDYARNQWIDQPVHVEVFSEKDAMSGILAPVTQHFNVPLNIIRGQSARPILYEIAQIWKRIAKPIHAFYIGDFDPSGLAIERSARTRIKSFIIGPFRKSKDPVKREAQKKRHREAVSHIRWTRLAPTLQDMQDLAHFKVPLNSKDPNLAAYIQETGLDYGLEADALPSTEMRRRLEAAILSLVNQEIWALR
jgi:hypothetical protein